MSQADLNRYKDFVEAVTSEESNDLEALIKRLRELDDSVNIALRASGSHQKEASLMRSSRSVVSKVSLWMTKLSSISSENWAILPGIGLVLAEAWVLTLTR